jgi:hypothetical protein
MTILPEKSTTITVQTGPGRHISAGALFAHLRDALEGREMHGEITLVIAGDGSVFVDRDGEREIVFRPKKKGGR